MNGTTLRYFVEIANEMNVTRAAKKLHISQQSLSEHIKRLEEEYGVEIFYRKPALRLTEEGERVLFYAKQMIRMEEQLSSELADVNQNCMGSISIGISRQRSQIFFSEIWEKYHGQYPNIHLSMREGVTLDFIEAMRQGELDLFLGINVSPVAGARLISLGQEQLFWLVPKELLPPKVRRKEALGMEEMKHIPMALFSKDNRWRKMLEPVFREKKVFPRIVVDSNSQQLLYQAALSGTAGTMISTLWLHYLKKNQIALPGHLTIRSVADPIPPQEVNLVMREGFEKTSYGNAFFSVLMETIGEEFKREFIV